VLGLFTQLLVHWALDLFTQLLVHWALDLMSVQMLVLTDSMLTAAQPAVTAI
jgi:hypothetical protein